MSDGLTAKQAAFVEAYADCLNATEAARRAGYKQPMQEGWRLLRNAEIRGAVDAAIKERAMPKDEVLTRLTAIATGSVRDLLRFAEEDVKDESGAVIVPAGTVIGLRLHRDAPLHLIKSITPTRYGDKIELHDPVGPLIKIGEAYGIFRDRGADALESLAAAALAAQAALNRRLLPPDDAGGAGGVPGEPEPDGGAGPPA